MDNIYNAIIMAGSVLLFVIGASVAVYNYGKIMEVNDKILTNSQYFDRTAENFQNSDYYSTNDKLNDPDTLKRIFSGDQIARMIINMYEAEVYEIEAESDKFVTSDISWDSISVEGLSFTKDGYDNQILNKERSIIDRLHNKKYVISDTYYEMSSEGVITKRSVRFKRWVG